MPSRRGKGVYVVQGEMAMVVSAMRRNTRWSSNEQDEQDPLLQSFGLLKQTLATVSDLTTVDVDVFLGPFLAVVRSEATTGPITGVALSSINKFLSYGLIDMASPQAACGIENIADAVTHAKFVGTDLASDEVVLMKILQVLRTILLTPVGTCMSNESVCELMQSCFRLSFEMRLTELLRKSAEQTLTDMVHLLFSRLGSLTDDATVGAASPVKKLKRTSSSVVTDGAKAGPAALTEVMASTGAEAQAAPSTETEEDDQEGFANKKRQVSMYNKQGVRFTPKNHDDEALVAYGVPCIVELFRFLISLINPRDPHNNETMMAMGLALITVALETGERELERFKSLMEHVEDGMCKNLMALLQSDNLTLYASALRVIFLSFESQRKALKFQLEVFLVTLTELDFPSYEHKELALDTLLQLCRVPGFLADLFINFDCSLYCSNLFEKIVKFLAQNAHSDDRVLTTHMYAMDCLLTMLNEINDRDAVALESNMPSIEELKLIRQKKLMLTEGVELFNKKPKKGIAYLQEKGILATGDDCWPEVVEFLRSDARLDKKQIGEYISARDSEVITSAYVTSFDVTEEALDMALRSFLTTFRLPGESRLIERIFEVFAHHWFTTFKGEKVPVNEDATFVLAYAIIQLNVDQHNPRVKKPMTFEEFSHNQRSLNDGADFPSSFLEDIYNNIKEREIVLPAERKGDLQKDYEWQMMLNRARNPKVRQEPCYSSVDTDQYDREIFTQVWGPTITALCYILDKATDQPLEGKMLQGLGICARLCARFEACDVFDALIVAMCKRVMLMTDTEDGVHATDDDDFASSFGINSKMQHTAQMIFSLVREHGSFLRHGWRDIFALIATFFVGELLPEHMMFAFNFISGKSSLRPQQIENDVQEASFFSSFLGFSSPSVEKTRSRVTGQKVEKAKAAVEECQIAQIFVGTAFFHDDSLIELTKALITFSTDQAGHKELGPTGSYNEMVAIFFLEALTTVVASNKDRAHLIWSLVQDHLGRLLRCETGYSMLSEHAIINLLRIAERLYMRDEFRPLVFESLRDLSSIPTEMIPEVRPQLVAGLTSFIKANASFITGDVWDLAITFYSTCDADPTALEKALDGLFFVVEGALTSDNVATCQQAAVNFVDFAIESTLIEPIGLHNVDDSEPRKPLSMRLLDLLHALHLAVPKVVTDHPLWTAHWEQLLQSMSRFCTVAPRSVRHHAIALLQSSLLQRDMDSKLTAAEWQACMENVLFPLMQSLLRPPDRGAQLDSLEEIRMRTSALLSKVFLQHLTALQTLDTFSELWDMLLGYMEKYLHAGPELAEAVPQLLKNLLLVMATHGVLVPEGPTKSTSHSLWSVTWNRIETFLPGMCAELFPNAQAPQLATSNGADAAAAAPTLSLKIEDAHSFSTPLRSVSGPARTGEPSYRPNIPDDSASLPSPNAAPIASVWRDGKTTVPVTPAAAGQPSPKLQLHSTPIPI